MRNKDKIEKYLDRLIKKYKGTKTEGKLSSYYFIKGRVIRISDHVGKNSSGNISIIFDSGDSGNYIIHGHKSGNIAILNYNQVKELVRIFSNMSFIFEEFSNIPTDAYKTINSNTDVNDLVDLLSDHLTRNQLKQLKNWFKYKKRK